MSDELIPAEFTRAEWRIIMVALGELPGKIMFDLAKKVEPLAKEQAK